MGFSVLGRMRGVVAVLFCGLLWGCAAGGGGGGAVRPHDPTPADKYVVYFYKTLSFSGSGRTHILKVDGRTIGEMIAGNYFKLEMWPGVYEITRYFPQETFLGITNRSQSQSRKLTLKPEQAGQVYLYKFFGEPSVAFTRWPENASDLNGRTLAKALSAKQTAQVKRIHGADYEGPALNRLPSGKGKLTWYDGAVYQGVFKDGEPTENGRLRYADGRVYMGGYRNGKPHGKGMLMDGGGRVLYSGGFSKGRPDGTGFSQGPSGPELREFKNGMDRTVSPAKQAEQIIAQQDRKVLDAIMAPAEAAEKEAGAAGERVRTYERRFREEKSEMAKRCHCVFNLCLTSVPYGETADEREAREDRWRKKVRLCKQWRRSGGDREAEFNSRLDAMNAEVDRLLEEKRRVRRQAEEAQRRKAAELKRTRDMRWAAERERQLRAREARIEQTRQWCLGELAAGRYRCECGAFAPKTGKGGVCEK